MSYRFVLAQIERELAARPPLSWRDQNDLTQAQLQADRTAQPTRLWLYDRECAYMICPRLECYDVTAVWVGPARYAAPHRHGFFRIEGNGRPIGHYVADDSSGRWAIVPGHRTDPEWVDYDELDEMIAEEVARVDALR